MPKFAPNSANLKIDDLDLIEIPPPAVWRSSNLKRRRDNQIAPVELIDLDEDGPDDAVVIDEIPSKDKQPILPSKNKQPMSHWTNQLEGHLNGRSLSGASKTAAWIEKLRKQANDGFSSQSMSSNNNQSMLQDNSWLKHAKGGFIDQSLPSANYQSVMQNIASLQNQALFGFPAFAGSSAYYGSAGSSKVYEAGPSLSKITNELEYPFGYDDFGDDLYDDIYNYSEYTDMYSEDGYGSSFVKFDNLDLPSGAEVTIPYLQPPAGDQPYNKSQKIVLDADIDVKYKTFKQFDTVQDHSDHYFNNPSQTKKSYQIFDSFRASSLPHQPSKDWAKSIQNDWKILEKDLPETIFVRVYEDRMDILRAVIIGPAGTPYHDGLFFFDIFFPPSYPQTPPQVHYHAGGLRLNPNLYACGKVCLSLLNTWDGRGCEKWNPKESTILQVLVSIQALVLNAKPYFNEPGFARSVNTPHGEKSSLVYNEKTFVLSCKTMLYSLQKPPKHFEEFVAGHFRKHGSSILLACKAYIGGAQVGCLVGDGVQDVDEGDKSSSGPFKSHLKMIFERLRSAFTATGADCEVFLPQTVADAKIPEPPTMGHHHCWI